jgi:hypothetical protein
LQRGQNSTRKTIGLPLRRGALGRWRWAGEGAQAKVVGVDVRRLKYLCNVRQKSESPHVDSYALKNLSDWKEHLALITDAVERVPTFIGWEKDNAKFKTSLQPAKNGLFNASFHLCWG